MENNRLFLDKRVPSPLIPPINSAVKSNMAKIFMDLNMVDYQVRKSNGAKEISQIVTDAKEATVQVICKEKE